MPRLNGHAHAAARVWDAAAENALVSGTARWKARYQAHEGRVQHGETSPAHRL